MAVKDKNTLKNYFETGDFPSQNQFEDLIDSLEHQDDTIADIGKQELVLLANQLESIENGFILYQVFKMGNEIILLDIAQQNASNQVIELSDTLGNEPKQYFLGDAPYTIRLKEFQSGNLGPTEYYRFGWQLKQQYGMQRLFGNSLPDIPQGFEFGVSDGKQLLFQISKENMGRELKIVHTSIKLVNTTGVAIAYRAASDLWNDLYTTTDSETDHYDAWDYLYFQFNADMTNQTQTIVCNLYNNDNGQLVQTTNLMPGQNYENAWAGQVYSARNILIECKKQ